MRDLQPCAEAHTCAFCTPTVGVPELDAVIVAKRNDSVCAMLRGKEVKAVSRFLRWRQMFIAVQFVHACYKASRTRLVFDYVTRMHHARLRRPTESRSGMRMCADAYNSGAAAVNLHVVAVPLEWVTHVGHMTEDGFFKGGDKLFFVSNHAVPLCRARTQLRVNPVYYNVVTVCD